MIKIVNEISWSDLENMLRKVPLKAKRSDGSSIFPYEHARICLREVVPSELCASSKYLIEKNMAFQRRLHDDLQSQGEDLFHLTGGLEILNEEGEVWRLIPPVVEVMHERVVHNNVRGDIFYDEQATVAVHIVNDGMHRVSLASELMSTLNVIHVSGIPDEFPYYALPNSWRDVKVFTDVPARKEDKKLYRRKDCYALYRDFDVLGCGKPRYTSGGSEVKK